MRQAHLRFRYGGKIARGGALVSCMCKCKGRVSMLSSDKTVGQGKKLGAVLQVRLSQDIGHAPLLQASTCFLPEGDKAP